MKLKILLVTLMLALAACTAAPTPQVTPEPSATLALQPTQPAAYPPAEPNLPGAYPPAANPYPGAGEPVATPGTAVENPFAPAAGDKGMNRGNVFLEEKDITTQAGTPAQYMLNLAGQLPTPCHQLRVLVGQPDAQNQIDVQVYSVSAPDEICTQVLKPFSESVPLGSFRAGTYTVMVNGEKAGQIAAP